MAPNELVDVAPLLPDTTTFPIDVSCCCGLPPPFCWLVAPVLLLVAFTLLVPVLPPPPALLLLLLPDGVPFIPPPPPPGMPGPWWCWCDTLLWCSRGGEIGSALIFTDSGEVDGGGVLFETARWGKPLECCKEPIAAAAAAADEFWLWLEAELQGPIMRSGLSEKSCAPNEPSVVV